MEDLPYYENYQIAQLNLHATNVGKYLRQNSQQSENNFNPINFQFLPV